MMDKSEQIEEMVRILLDADFFTQHELDTNRGFAEALYAAGYRKVGERPKVLSQEDSGQLAERLAGDYPLLDFSFWDDYREETTIMLQTLREADIKHYEGVKDV